LRKIGSDEACASRSGEYAIMEGSRVQLSEIDPIRPYLAECSG